MDKVNSIPGTVLVDGATYAVNLIWGCSRDAKSASEDLKKNMALLDSRLFLETETDFGRQYAVGDKSLGHKRGMVSLLSTLNVDGRSLCALLPADNDNWVLFGADKEGNILFDKAFITKSDAVSYFREYVYFYTEWDNIYCPEDIGAGQEIELGELIIKKGKKLQESGLWRLLPIAGIGGVVIITFMLIYSGINWWLDRQETEIVVRPQPALQERIEHVSIPWGGRSQPLSLIQECSRSLSEKRILAASVPGWIPDKKVSCGDAQISFTVKKQDGLSLWLSYANEFFSPVDKPEISQEGQNAASFTWHLTTLKYPVGKLVDNMIPKTSEGIEYLRHSFENSFIKIDIENPKSSGIRNDIFLITFKFSIKMDPLLVMPILDNINGIVLNSIDYDYSSGEWSFAGQFWGIGS